MEIIAAFTAFVALLIAWTVGPRAQRESVAVSAPISAATERQAA